MTARQLFENVCQTLMIERGNNSPDFIRARVIDDLNAAIQVMTTGIDFFTRQTVTLAISQGSPTASLPEDTLNVFGPVRIGDEMLTEAKSRGEIDQFAQLYLGYKNAAPTGRPYAYFVEKKLRAVGENSVALVARFSPAPNASFDVDVEISKRPAAYTVADLSEPSPELPVPHGFCESILLPIVRWNVRTSHFFNMPAMLPSMEQEYKAALNQLGLSEPTQGAATGDLLERKKQAARAAARDAYNSTQ